MNAKSELIRLAAEMLRGKNMPSMFADDWKLPASTPTKVIRTIEKVGETADEQCRLWATRLKEISDSL